MLYNVAIIGIIADNNTRVYEIRVIKILNYRQCRVYGNARAELCNCVGTGIWNYSDKVQRDFVLKNFF